MIGDIDPIVLDAIVAQVARALPARVTSGTDWTEFSEGHLWRELVACILGSAVSFDAATRAVAALECEGLLSPGVIPDGDLLSNCSKNQARYRFPIVRANQIVTTAERIYGTGHSFGVLLSQCPDANTARRSLISVCSGIGPKQASMFLRNIGFSEHAILDRHVLTFLRLRKLIARPICAISSINMYESIEQIIASYASHHALSLVQVDLAVWVAMRVITSEESRWAS